jgi:hypothetical protein
LAAGLLVAAAALTACSSKHDSNVASAATSFSQESATQSAPVTTPSQGSPAPSSASASTPAPPQTSDAAVLASPTPCPVAAPQIFVEGKSATHSADGGVTFSYLDAQRMCGGPDDVQFVTTGKKLNTAPVASSAVVKLLPSTGSTQALQVPVAALPAAMASNTGAPYYAITVDGTGTITNIEQYFHP